MEQAPLPRWPRPLHRCSPRGPRWPRMAAIIAPLPTRWHLAPRWSALRPTGRPSPEEAAGNEAQGAFPHGGAAGVTALCSETMGVHQDDGSETCASSRSASPQHRLTDAGPVAVLMGVQPQPVGPTGGKHRDDALVSLSFGLNLAK